jgi:hypothetical protein
MYTSIENSAESKAPFSEEFRQDYHATGKIPSPTSMCFIIPRMSDHHASDFLIPHDANTFFNQTDMDAIQSAISRISLRIRVITMIDATWQTRANEPVCGVPAFTWYLPCIFCPFGFVVLSRHEQERVNRCSAAVHDVCAQMNEEFAGKFTVKFRRGQCRSHSRWQHSARYDFWLEVYKGSGTLVSPPLETVDRE